MIDNANLVKKVAFPREILPLSSVGVALLDFVLQSAVFLLFILVTGHGCPEPSALSIRVPHAAGLHDRGRRFWTARSTSDIATCGIC